jgi:hypothetical protein
MNPNLILPVVKTVIPNFIYQNTSNSFEEAQMHVLQITNKDIPDIECDWTTLKRLTKGFSNNHVEYSGYTNKKK